MTHFETMANILAPIGLPVYMNSVIDVEAQELPSLTFADYVKIARHIDNLILSEKAEKGVSVDISNKNVLCFDFDMEAVQGDVIDLYLSNVVISLENETEEPIKLDKQLLSGLFMTAPIVTVYQNRIGVYGV